MAHLFRHGVGSSLEQDFDTWGQPPPEYLEAIRQADEFEIWPENVQSLQTFMRLQTQWVYGLRGPVGLNYAGVRAALDMMRTEVTTELFDDLQVMESAALKILTEGANGS